MKRAGLAGRFAAGLLVSALFVWLALRGKDLGAMGRAFADADYAYLVPYLGVLLGIHLIRTARWGVLLSPLGEVPFRHLNRACAVGFMALVLLPFRLGELARPYLVSTRNPRRGEGVSDIRMSSAAGTIVVERITDGLTVAGMLLGSLVINVGDRVGEEIAYVRSGAYLLLGLFGAALAALLLVWWQEARAVAVVRAVLGRVAPRLAVRVAGLLGSFIEGLKMAPSRGKLALFLGLTLAFWGVNGAGLWMMTRAFDLEIGLLAMYTVLGVQVIGVMIPAGPGMLGTFQFFTLVGMSVFLPRDVLDGPGAAYANLVWLMQFAQQVGLGLVFLVLGHLSFGRIVAAPEETLAE